MPVTPAGLSGNPQNEKHNAAHKHCTFLNKKVPAVGFIEQSAVNPFRTLAPRVSGCRVGCPLLRFNDPPQEVAIHSQLTAFVLLFYCRCSASCSDSPTVPGQNKARLLPSPKAWQPLLSSPKAWQLLPSHCEESVIPPHGLTISHCAAPRSSAVWFRTDWRPPDPPPRTLTTPGWSADGGPLSNITGGVAELQIRIIEHWRYTAGGGLVDDYRASVAAARAEQLSIRALPPWPISWLCCCPVAA